MTGNPGKPGEEQPAETPSPGQQKADDGSEEGANTFGNIDPGDEPSDDEVGGG